MIALISRVMASREGFAYVVMTVIYNNLHFLYHNEASHKNLNHWLSSIEGKLK